MPITSLQDLYLDQLRDVYSVESQLIPALEELASAATSQALRRQLQRHKEETLRQKERLETIARRHEFKLKGDSSKAMEGLIEGGHAHIKEAKLPATRDMLIVAHTHRIEHYELAAYGVVLALADQLGLNLDSESLRTSLEEEQTMDESLTDLASRELLGAVPSE